MSDDASAYGIEDEQKVDIARDDINDPTDEEKVSDLTDNEAQELEEDTTDDPEYEKS